jgi:hypothetical protein
MLLTDGFGGSGDIAKFNRDFMQALDASAALQAVLAGVQAALPASPA